MSIDPESVSRVSATQDAEDDTMSHSSDHDTFHNTAIDIEEEEEQFHGDPVEATKYLK